MYAKNDYIESLDIPQSDKDLLYKFEHMDYGSINPDLCQSERAKEEARNIMHDALRREEYSCGIY